MADKAPTDLSGVPKQERSFAEVLSHMRLMNFGQALRRLHDGCRVTRTGWNGPGQYVVLQKGYPTGIPLNANTAEATGIPEGTVCVFRPYLMLRTVDGSFVPWVATQTDILAKDWISCENSSEGG